MEAQLKIEEVYMQRHAALMKAAIARNGRLPAAQPDPVQVWRFGPKIAEAGSGARWGERSWTTRSVSPASTAAPHVGRGVQQRRLRVRALLRVLREGGYEGGDAMIYYGRPGPFTEEVEGLILGKVRRLVRDAG